MFFLALAIFDKTGTDPILCYLQENGFDKEVAEINTHKENLKVDQCRYAYFEYKEEEEFKEIIEYCQDIEKEYSLTIEKYENNIKNDLEYLVNEENVTTILIGNRRTDPYSQKLKPIEKSSEGWPDFTRVHPILDWDYNDVWKFINFFKFKV